MRLVSVGRGSKNVRRGEVCEVRSKDGSDSGEYRVSPPQRTGTATSPNLLVLVGAADEKMGDGPRTGWSLGEPAARSSSTAQPKLTSGNAVMCQVDAREGAWRVSVCRACFLEPMARALIQAGEIQPLCRVHPSLISSGLGFPADETKGERNRRHANRRWMDGSGLGFCGC